MRTVRKQLEVKKYHLKIRNGIKVETKWEGGGWFGPKEGVTRFLWTR